jgi:curved DNA-binding protein CbpA
MGRDPYDILGVRRDAGDEEIRRAYHRRAKEQHPDAGGRNDDYFCRLNEAYEEIRTEARRRAHERTRPGELRKRPWEGARSRQLWPAGFAAERRPFAEPGLGSILEAFERLFAGHAGRGSRSYRISVELSATEADRGMTLEVSLPEGLRQIELPAGVRDGDELTYHERDAVGGELCVTVDVRVRSRSR